MSYLTPSSVLFNENRVLTVYPYSYGSGYDMYATITDFSTTTLVKHYDTSIGGVAKTDSSSGEPIEVYTLN